ncbi:hypothetical protein CANCADRAFT_26628 [Tortispora caseinolytica NRRL Y-17796]|uniref:Arp2/3 complex 34 kDa subunit n=1 Tax=Tortispora caseinolytica NRRL Y-17796 TaxID=767744 RepID=A0A1E4TDV9_9ASCO|nr:hypothetical protein CANCADRAFT_26628 [Tortispora caseinolytica NRRL Y-17796]
MLLLQYHNLLLQSILTERLEPGASLVYIDQIISDFDYVTFHVSTPETKSVIVVSLAIKCWSDLVKYGAESVLKREYGSYITETEPGYNFSLKLDVEALQQENAELREALIDKIALLKRHAMAAPFEKAFDTFEQLEKAAQSTDRGVPEESDTEVMTIHYRDEESIFVRPSFDRVTVIFSIIFREETDKIFGKVFLQEFVDARRRAIQNAPQVLYSSSEPPLEIRHVPAAKMQADMGYVTFVLFPRHMTAMRRENCISHVQMFRDFFLYHIKCSKAYLHSRMRYRVSEFLKILNRAKPENVEKERKTASGRRFVST